MHYSVPLSHIFKEVFELRVLYKASSGLCKEQFIPQ